MPNVGSDCRSEERALGQAQDEGDNRAPSSVYLVRYDPRIGQIPIKAAARGERTLPHR